MKHSIENISATLELFVDGLDFAIVEFINRLQRFQPKYIIIDSVSMQYFLLSWIIIIPILSIVLIQYLRDISDPLHSGLFNEAMQDPIIIQGVQPRSVEFVTLFGELED